jgi:hypothetical protein
MNTSAEWQVLRYTKDVKDMEDVKNVMDVRHVTNANGGWCDFKPTVDEVTVLSFCPRRV